MKVGRLTSTFRVLAAAVLVIATNSRDARAGEVLTGGLAESTFDFGRAVAIDGDTVVVGGRGVAPSPSKVFVFVRQGTQFIRRATLVRSVPVTAPTDEFGFSVAVSGETIVVGAPAITSNEPGEAFVFIRPAVGWQGTLTESARLIPRAGATQSFGRDVALSARGEVFVTSTQTESVYVFLHPGGSWAGTVNEVARLVPSGDPIGHFGGSLAASGDTVVVGSNLSANEGHDGGEAYVYVRPAEGWSEDVVERAVLSAPFPASEFASSVDVSGNVIVAGAPFSRKAFVFVEPNSGWSGPIETPNAQLVPSIAPSPAARYGDAVAIDGDAIVVGAPEIPQNPSFSDHAYRFLKPVSGWSGAITESSRYNDPTSAGIGFGRAVALEGDTTLISEPSSNVDPNFVYVFHSDGDNDLRPDRTDNCPTISNAGQLDTDHDGQGDACDPDDDNDGFTDSSDNCPLADNEDQSNVDGDAQGDACDPDDDNDAVADVSDNCPAVPNPGQSDIDGDGHGDRCDLASVVGIDVDPGSTRNKVDKRSVPIAILAAPTFDPAAHVQRSSLRFGPTGTEVQAIACGAEDANGDGRIDLVCTFNGKLAGFPRGQSVGALSGETLEGTAFSGTDSVSH